MEMNVEFTEELSNHLCFISDESIKFLNSLQMKSFAGEKIAGSIHEAIKNKVNKYSLLEDKTFDLYDFFTDLYIMILMGHFLKNGNKRLALVFLVMVMETFGFIIIKQHGLTADNIKKLIVLLEGNKTSKKDKGYKLIKKHLKKISSDRYHDMKSINKIIYGANQMFLKYTTNKHFYTSKATSSPFLSLIRKLDKH